MNAIGLDIIYPGILACIAIWVFDNFYLARRRILQAKAMVEAGNHDIKALLEESNIGSACRYAFYALLALLIFASIRESADLQLILFIAIALLCVFWLIDVAVLRKPRKALLHASANEKTQELAKVDVTLVEYSKSFVPLLILVFVLRAFVAEPFQIPSASMKPTLVEGDFVVVSKFGYGLKLPVLDKEIVDLGDPQPGDVIVFKPPHEPQMTYIKRLVAVPGDHVRYDLYNKRLYLNGALVPETLLGTEMVDGRTVDRYQSEINGVEFEMFKTPGFGISYATPLLMEIELKRRLQDNPNLANLPDYQDFYHALEIYKGFTLGEGEYFAIGDNRDNSKDSRFWGVLAEDKIQGRAMAVWLHWPKLLSVPSFKNNKVLSGASDESE